MKANFNIVLINRAGKVGKSTLAKNLIAPMLGAEWVQVETINDSGEGATERLAGRKFRLVAEATAASMRSLCIDIGSSNYEAAMKEMRQIAGFAEDIDFWVIPCTNSGSVVNDTEATIEDLVNILDVEPARIVVIPNRVDREDMEGFSKLEHAAREKGFHFATWGVEDAPMFDVFNKDKRSVMGTAAETKDYRALIHAEADPSKRAELSRQLVKHRQAKSIAGALLEAWSSTPLAALARKAAAS